MKLDGQRQHVRKALEQLGCLVHVHIKCLIFISFEVPPYSGLSITIMAQDVGAAEPGCQE